jgi:hypothetical protein
MKTKFIISILLVSIYCLPIKASVYEDKKMTEKGITYNLNYCLPKDYDQSNQYPLIVAMHYCGGTSKQYRDCLSLLSDSLKMIVVCPDNNSVVIPESQLNMLVTAIDSSKVFYNIDETKVYLTGMSCNGEFIIRHGLTNFYPFKGIFPWDAWITSTSPELYNYDCKIPIVIAVGSHDPNFVAQVAMYDSLKAHNATVSLVIVANIAHQLFDTFSQEMINCIYYLNGTPDFSFEPIKSIDLLSNDSVLVDVFVNNPGNKKLNYSATFNNNVYIKKMEIIPGDTQDHFKLKLVPKKRTGKIIITVKAFDEIKKEMAQEFITINLKEAPATVGQIGQKDFKIYPVPVTDYLYFESNEQNISVSITDVSGKEMMNFKDIKTSDGILVQLLPKGFYYLTANGNETVKFLKQ